MENSRPEEEKTIKDIRNLFRLKKYRILRDIKNLFEHEKKRRKLL